MSPNTRVGAILSGDKDSIKFLGYGTYVGDEVPPTEASAMLHHGQIKNPKIVLDNGDVVFGFECWWGPEEAIKKRVDGHAIIEVRIADHRS